MVPLADSVMVVVFRLRAWTFFVDVVLGSAGKEVD